MKRHLLTISIILLPVSERCALATQWVLEGAFVASSYFPTARGESTPYAGVGASGTISYEIERWGFGIRTQGTLSNYAHFHVEAGSYDLSGQLPRREYGISALTRYFLSGPSTRRSLYLEFLFAARQTDFSHSEVVYTLPSSPDYTRLFLRGGGFGLGIGYRPDKGPWFLQLNYELDHYETLLLVGSYNHMHQIAVEPTIRNNYFVHSIFLTVGLDVFER